MACRCTELQGLDDAALKVCLRAASHKLLYPGTIAGRAADAAGAAPSEAKQVKDGQTASSTDGAVAHDLAALHTAYQRTQNKVENMLSRTVVSEGSWTFAEQAFVVIAALGVGAFAYSRYKAYRLSKAKGHSRSE